MKRVGGILVLSFFVLVGGVAHGQMQVDMGLKGGINFANVNAVSTVVSTYGTQIGYHGGAYASFRLGKVAIQPEIIYSTEGQQYKYVQPGYPSLKSTFGYINIPIMLKVYLAGGFNLQAGPQFGYLNNSKGYSYQYSANGAPIVASQSMGDYVKAYNVSLGLGAGLDLPFGLNFTLRYNAGLSDINKLTGNNQSALPGSPFGTSAAKSEVLQISVGYRLFKIGG